jgi:hypothetical protein
MTEKFIDQLIASTTRLNLSECTLANITKINLSYRVTANDSIKNISKYPNLKKLECNDVYI